MNCLTFCFFPAFVFCLLLALFLMAQTVGTQLARGLGNISYFSDLTLACCLTAGFKKAGQQEHDRKVHSCDWWCRVYWISHCCGTH